MTAQPPPPPGNDEWAADLRGGPPAGGQPAPGPPPAGPADQGEAEALRAALAAKNEQQELEKFVRSRRYRQKADEIIEAEAKQQTADRRHVRLTPASSFRIRAVKWVWDGRMPVGEITLIPGREGAGKSTFLAWMAAEITRGTLPGMFHGHPRGVLYAATEDSWEYTIAPRLLAAGADMDRVFRIDVQHEEGRYGKLALPVDTNLIPKAAAEADAAVLMCDPIISMVDDRINTFKAQELRSALEPLKRAIEEAGIALPGLVHFNKSKDSDVLSMISGSRAWAEVARAVIAIAVDKDADEYTCVVSQVKNNLGRSDLPHLKYTIRSHVLRAADHGAVEEDTAIGRLAWTGESERGAEEILTTKPEGATTGEATDAVVEFVARQFVALGSRRVPVAQIAGEFADMSRGTLGKLLARCVQRGTLTNPARGFYEPGRAVERPCPGGCGRKVSGDANFCRVCVRELDAADRAAGGRDGDPRLF